MFKKLLQFIKQDFNEEFFEDNQDIILKVANKWYLSWLLGLHRLPKELKGKVIDKITPNSINTIIGIKDDKYEVKGTFFTRPRFSEAMAFNLSPFTYLKNNAQTKFQWRFSPVGAMAMLTIGFFSKGLGFFFIGSTTTSYYAGAGDGATVNAYDTDWQTIREEGTASQGLRLNPTKVRAFKDGTTDDRFGIGRAFYPIDTSAIPDTDEISSATLSLYANTKQTTVNLVMSNQTQSNTAALALADYDQITLNSPTEYATRKSSGDYSTSAYVGWSLNSTGLAGISKTGYTKLSIRTANDVDDSEPANATYLGIYFYGSTETGTTKDPYLSVTYTVVTTDIKSYNGLAYASIKSINGVAKADMKSFNGLE